MDAAFRQAFGYDLPINDSYRDYAAQVEAKAIYGSEAAPPGTSNHGWALAIDIGTFTQGLLHATALDETIEPDLLPAVPPNNSGGGLDPHLLTAQIPPHVAHGSEICVYVYQLRFLDGVSVRLMVRHGL